MKNHEKKIWYKIPLPFLSQKHQKTHFKKVVPTNSPILTILYLVLYAYTAFLKNFRGVAQFGRAPGLGPGGRKFESCHLDLAEVAGKTRLRDAGAVPLFLFSKITEFDKLKIDLFPTTCGTAVKRFILRSFHHQGLLRLWCPNRFHKILLSSFFHSKKKGFIPIQ